MELNILRNSFFFAKPLFEMFPQKIKIQLHSKGRKWLNDMFSKQNLPANLYTPDLSHERHLWGIKFRAPIFSSAGMFKNGDGYDVVSKIGAGAYIGGTSTYNPRAGQTKLNVHLPFLKLHDSKISINYFGLPNEGDEILSRKVITNCKIDGCPIGWSLMRSPDFQIEEAQDKLIKSLFLYQDNAQIDFIEINESCPNVKKSSANILLRLDNIAEEFLKKRKRKLPIIVKVSNDLSKAALRDILTKLVELKFDGINIGNTSTDYSAISDQIVENEKKIFNYFTSEIGGGVGGRILKEKSLDLCSFASQELKRLNPKQEFHIIRTGGIESFEDIIESDKVGVSMNQWLTGFFYLYLNEGNKVYKSFFEGNGKSKKISNYI